MSGVKSVSRHKETSAGGGSLAQYNLAICVVQLVPLCHQGGSTKTTGGP